MEGEILKIAKRIQAISQTGIRFTKDNFDNQRFEELRELSVQLVSDAKIDKIRDLFTTESGFQTPKIDIRAVVLKDNKILLTKERSDRKWSLPDGYADINYSPLEFHFYKIVVLCDLIGGQLRGSDETEDANFFNFDKLPELSVKRNTYELIDLLK